MFKKLLKKRGVKMENVEIASNIDWNNAVRLSDFNQAAVINHLGQKVLPELKDVEKTLQQEQSKIFNDEKLTLEGKKAKLLDVAQKQVEPTVKKYEKERDTAEKSANSHIKEMLKTENSHLDDDVKAQIRQREIRDELRKLEKGEILKLLQSAADNNDIELIRAIEDAPKSFPLVDAEILEQFRQARLAKKFPERMKQVEDLRKLAEFYNLVAGDLRKRHDRVKSAIYRR